MPMSLKLIYSPICPPARSVLLVCKALNLRPQIETVNLLTNYKNEEFKKLNPRQTIPTIKDGTFVLWDSHAIAEYLVKQYGQGTSLCPQVPRFKADIEQKLHFDSEFLFPKTVEAIAPILFKRKTGISHTSKRNIHSSYKLLEQFLQKSPWLVGNETTIADLCCISSITTLDLVQPIREKMYPNLYKYLENCKKLSYYHEGNQEGLDDLAELILDKLIINRTISN